MLQGGPTCLASGMSSQIPLSLPSLPNLLTQPFSQIPYRNLTNLNPHAWPLEPQQSRSRASLRQRQQELRLLKEIPSWNLSLVLHQPTKAPFEPIKEASLKHLTFKTVFLLALGSGKSRSEIHAWQNKNIRHQSEWSKVSLYPSPSFLSKNQLASIPALAVILCYELLCYELLCYDQEAHSLHQVKAHDVRAFAASKAFQSGVSLEQILSACHWKSHNTFMQVYLKNVAWADSELYHLGSVVAAQQILQ